jgi:hypothetical protein
VKTIRVFPRRTKATPDDALAIDHLEARRRQVMDRNHLSI